MVMTMVSTEKKNGGVVTAESITEKIDKILEFYGPFKGSEFTNAVDRDALQRDIETACNVYIAHANVMDDNTNHTPWLDEVRDDVNWRFWSRYKQYQLAEGLAPDAVDRLDTITDMVLGRLENPRRDGTWDRRGLVAGQVQSGKTGNYIGLICKAVDAGYKLIVVLAGVHNSLRAQTQARVDEGVLGFSTELGLTAQTAGLKFVGVGHQGFLHIMSFTSRKQNGDFNKAIAEKVGVAPGGAEAIVMVVKKNKSVLDNINTWATNLNKVVDEEGNEVVQGVPLLIIDDEADQASVDTNGPKKDKKDDSYDPPVINGLIRKLLKTFQQSAYVGYTATPFANIFVDPDVEHDTAGKGLFPESFIVSLPAPSNYVGPARVFGLKEDVTRNIDELDALPMVRAIADWETWIPDRHKQDLQPGQMPASLKQAMLSFTLTVALRRWRGQVGKHNSMLVHVTRFTAVQKIVRQQVQDELQNIKNHLLNGDPATDETWARAHALYDSDYLGSTPAFADADDVADQIGLMPAWEELAAGLAASAQLIEVREVNGTVKDALEYVDHPEGLNVIAVGGAKLSRGLTLEGLSVSYYLAGARMYDTLLQMGRWFGYRPGYLDLCRLYTTDELRRRYVLVTAATEELYREFDYMVALGSKPREFGLRVKQHPDGLMVTAPNKMRHAKKLSMSFAGGLSETVTYDTTAKARERNWAALETLIGGLPGEPVSENEAQGMGAGQSLVWKGIDGSHVTRFLDEYIAHPDSHKVQPKPLGDYIRSRMSDTPAELTDWWILLANSSTAEQEGMVTVAGHNIGLTQRRVHKEQSVTGETGRLPIRRLVSPPHERIDVTPGTPAFQRALKETARMWAESPRKDLKEKGEPTQPAGVACRHVRPATRGLLLLYPLTVTEAPEGVSGGPYVGFALSFPGSDRAVPVDYQVAKDLWLQITGVRVTGEGEEEDDADPGQAA